MNVEALIAIAGLIEKIGVPAVQQLIAVLHKAEPTQADWDEVFTRAQTPFATGLKDGVLK